MTRYAKGTPESVIKAMDAKFYGNKRDKTMPLPKSKPPPPRFSTHTVNPIMRPTKDAVRELSRKEMIASMNPRSLPPSPRPQVQPKPRPQVQPKPPRSQVVPEKFAAKMIKRIKNMPDTGPYATGGMAVKAVAKKKKK